MKKYFTEENIDFYKILNDTLNESNTQNEDMDVCLITKTPLEEYYVKLDCGHKFNYISLYTEVIQQKFRLNNNTLNKEIIQCPYCRTPYNKLLPYYPNMKLSLIYQVNTDDIFYKVVFDKRTKKIVYENTLQYNYFDHCQCSYIYPKDDTSNAELFDDSLNQCSTKCVIMHLHTYKPYCYAHIGIAKKEYIQELKELAKQKKIEEKNANKQKKIQEKNAIKQKKIQEKELAKQKKIQEK